MSDPVTDPADLPVPEPAQEAADDEARNIADGKAAMVAVLTALTGFGVVSAMQADLLLGLLGLAPGLVALVGVWWAKAQAVWKLAASIRDKITPTSAPGLLLADGRRVRLVPEHPTPASGDGDPVDPVPRGAAARHRLRDADESRGATDVRGGGYV
jgi:hypothetical protein